MKLQKIVCALVLSAASLLVCAMANARPIYSVYENNVIKGDFHIKPGEIVNKNILITSGTVFIEGTLGGVCIADGGDIVVTGKVDGNVVSLGEGKSVTVSGLVTGDVDVYRGHINISGKVGGYTIALESPLVIDAPAVVQKIRTYNSIPEIKPGAKVDRSLIETLTLAQVGQFLPSYNTYKPHSMAEQSVMNICIAAGLGLALLLPVFFMPRKMESIALSMENEFWKSCGFGLLALLPAAGILASMIFLRGKVDNLNDVLIFLFGPVVTVITSMGLFIGLAAFCRMAGNKLAALAGRERPEPFTASVVGCLPLVAMMMPMMFMDGSVSQLRMVLVWLYMSGCGVAGLGAAIGLGALLRCSPNPFRRE